MYDRQLVLLKYRQQWRQARVQSEKSVQIQRCFVASALWLGDCNRRAHPVIIRLAKRNHDIQSIRRTALEQHHQLLFSLRWSRRDRALQECWDRAEADHGDSALLHEIPPRKFRWPRSLAALIVHKYSFGVHRSAAAFARQATASNSRLATVTQTAKARARSRTAKFIVAETLVRPELVPLPLPGPLVSPDHPVSLVPLAGSPTASLASRLW